MPAPPIHPTTAYQPPSPRTKLQNYLKQKGAALEKASSPPQDGVYRSSSSTGLNSVFLPPSGTPSPYPAVTPLQIHTANPAVRLSSPKRDTSLDLPPRTTGPEQALPGQGRDPAAHFLNSHALSGAPPHLHGAGRTDTQASTELRACLNTMRASFMELSDTVTRAQNTKGSPKRSSGGKPESGGTRQDAAEGEDPDPDPESKWLIRTRTPPPRAARERIEPGSPVVGGGMPHRVREMEAPHQGARDPATCPKCKAFLAMPPPGSIRTACTHCGAKYNAVSCPNCKIANFWQQGEFVQGADSQCLACKVNFAMVLCPGVGCGTPYYAERFLQGVPTECPRCHFDFAMISCPQCHCSNFWKATEYKQGARTECSECHHAFAMVNCNGCGVATFWNKPVANTHSVLCKSCKKMAPSVGA